MQAIGIHELLGCSYPVRAWNSHFQGTDSGVEGYRWILEGENLYFDASRGAEMRMLGSNAHLRNVQFNTGQTAYAHFQFEDTEYGNSVLIEGMKFISPPDAMVQSAAITIPSLAYSPAFIVLSNIVFGPTGAGALITLPQPQLIQAGVSVEQTGYIWMGNLAATGSYPRLLVRTGTRITGAYQQFPVPAERY